MYPLIYSNLALTIKAEDNFADTNAVYAGSSKLGAECATTA